MLKGQIIVEIQNQLTKFLFENYPHYKFISKCNEVIIGKPNNNGKWIILEDNGQEHYLEKDEALTVYLNYQREVIEGLEAKLRWELIK